MPASKAKSLSSLVHSAIKSKASAAVSLASPAAEDTVLKQFVSSPSSKPKSKRSTKPKNPTSKPTAPESSSKQQPGETFTILCGGTSANSTKLEETGDEKSLEKELVLPWCHDYSHCAISSRRKVPTRERKQKWIFSSSQVNRVSQIVGTCADKLGTGATIQVFDKLGRETGLKEYNSLIKICIERARGSSDEDVALEQIHMAFKIFKSMKERGFPLEEETYGQFLAYLVDMGTIEEFQFFCGVIKTENPSSVARLGYYEMLLWIRVNDEEKIQELCNFTVNDDGGKMSALQENYLLALSESDRKKEILQLLEIMDITKLSLDCVAGVFRCFGRLRLETYAEKCFRSFTASDCEAGNITNFIYIYVVGIPNLAVEDVISNFKGWHMKLEVAPSSASYKKLITYCCDSLKVHVALALVDEMCQLGLTCSIEAVNSILRASGESCDFHLVLQIYSMICQYKLQPNSETFRSMISLYVKMKDYEGAYSMLIDLGKMNLTPTASMYNAIMGGFFREKNIYGVLRVLQQMKEAGVKPDSQTFSYLISNCDCEEDIDKYYEELKRSGIQVTKQIFMSLVNAYATCGQLEKAKQVVLDKEIPVKSLNEIKSVLVQSLALNGQWCDAFNIYEEMKQAGCSSDPKAVISLIEHFQPDEELSTIQSLLEELDDPDYWFHGCRRTILYCVRYKYLRPAVNLLEQLRDKTCADESALEVVFNQVFSVIAQSESTYLQFGLDLLHAMKDELGLTPSRKCLDFLLHACSNAKDLKNSKLIWKEYEAAGLPYNTLSFLRMYQALLAAGDFQAVKLLRRKIPADDPHVRCIISACRSTYFAAKKKKKNE